MPETDVFPQHVEAQLLQRLEIVDHGFPIRRGVDAIRPAPREVSGDEDAISDAPYQKPWSRVPNGKMNSPFKRGR